jgi:hypothetical protein
MSGIPELDFASSALGLVCHSDGQGCASLAAPELNEMLSTWKPIYLPSGCACFPGAAGGGNPGDLCFRPSGADDYHCQRGVAGVDVCDKAWLWCASKQCAVPEGELWGACL